MTTDIWSWVHDTHGRLVESGQHRLATALAEIAGHAVDGRNEQLDAMFPEALASARALGLPWVEVFLRHWRLQNLLNKRHQGERAMTEAVSLLEYAHREETAGCPQAVCAVQDFTICHANIDGPGYVPERLAVLEEALERVEPARACFDCLSREYADTLEDDGRAEAALATWTGRSCGSRRPVRASRSPSGKPGPPRCTSSAGPRRRWPRWPPPSRPTPPPGTPWTRTTSASSACSGPARWPRSGATTRRWRSCRRSRRPRASPTSGTAGPRRSSAWWLWTGSRTTPGSVSGWPTGSPTWTRPDRTAPAWTWR